MNNAEIVRRWCRSQGHGWSLKRQAGRGGTAPVFVIETPKGDRAFKLYDEEFSTGDQRDIQERRVAQQVELGEHECPYLVKVVTGGRYEDRLFLVMHLAEGQELEKRLGDVPRSQIRQVVDKVSQACSYLRDRGLCHRDIKAANIFISDDFQQVTLLDLSVMREISDPVGLGTDHNNQLPVVATARYSPPEYLFRLIDPGPDLWHAVDVYQLGALLHDLIMREPLFSEEFARSKENRYRFAWIVAVAAPRIEAADVDADLIFLARRALDKDWKRRSILALDEFRCTTEAQRTQAMSFLGLGKPPPVFKAAPDLRPGDIRRRLIELASNLDEQLTDFVKRLGQTAKHSQLPGDDDSTRVVKLEWEAGSGSPETGGLVELTVTVRLDNVQGGPTVSAAVELAADVEGTERRASMAVPPLADSSHALSTLAENIEAAVGDLGRDLLASKS